MRRLSAAFVGMIIGGGLVFAAFHYHLVRADEGFLMIPREERALVDTYADIREWDAATWEEHSELATDLTAHGRGDLVVRSMTRTLLEKLIKKIDSGARRELDKIRQ